VCDFHFSLEIVAYTVGVLQTPNHLLQTPFLIYVDLLVSFEFLQSLGLLLALRYIFNYLC